MRTCGVNVDDVAPFEVGLKAAESEQQIEGRLVQGVLFVGVGGSYAATDQVVGVALQRVVDELGAKRLFVRAGQPRLVLALAVGLSVGERSGDLGAQLPDQAGVDRVAPAPCRVGVGATGGHGHGWLVPALGGLGASR